MAANDGTKFKIVKKLGEGGFGQVFLIEDIHDSSKKHAMKLMNVAAMDEQEIGLATQEIKLLSSLSHKHLLQYVDCFTQDGQLCIITEFCPNGDLGDYICSQRGTRIEETRLVEWFRQIASAVEYLHSKNIIHRDLKVDNVFLNASMDCVLGDLGVARLLDSATDFAQTQIGTIHYMSPEIFMGIPYNAKTDVWGLAVLIYELAALEKPFDSFLVPALIFKITQGNKPDMPTGYSPDFTDLLSRMMEKDPDDRLSSSQVLKHKLFQKKAKPKPMASLKGDISDSEEYTEATAFLASFLETFSIHAKDRQRPKAMKKMAALQEGDEEEESPEMTHVSRTLISMGLFASDKVYEKGRTGILRKQVDQLKMYCLHVLDNDKTLFDRANKELDKTDDDEELEEKLIRVLGHEKFGMCGLQLLHYKNYSFNLRKA